MCGDAAVGERRRPCGVVRQAHGREVVQVLAAPRCLGDGADGLCTTAGSLLLRPGLACLLPLDDDVAVGVEHELGIVHDGGSRACVVDAFRRAAPGAVLSKQAAPQVVDAVVFSHLLGAVGVVHGDDEGLARAGCAHVELAALLGELLGVVISLERCAHAARGDVLVVDRQGFVEHACLREPVDCGLAQCVCAIPLGFRLRIPRLQREVQTPVGAFEGERAWAAAV